MMIFVWRVRNQSQTAHSSRALVSEMEHDIIGAMLSHNLSKLSLLEQERIRTDFCFVGASQGVDRDMEILRSIRAVLQAEKRAREPNKKK